MDQTAFMEFLSQFAALLWTSDPAQAVGAFTTRGDARCRRLVIRQRRMGVMLRRRGVHPIAAISAAWAHDERAFRFARVAR